MNDTNEGKDRLQIALDGAAERVASLPPELKATAFQEAFRALYGANGHAAATESPRNSTVQISTADLPEAADVKHRGGRTVKVAYAIASLSSGPDACVSTAIKAYLGAVLATKIKGNGLTDVLRSGTPKYFSRTKGEGREYVYGLTPVGRKLLADFGAGIEDAR